MAFIYWLLLLLSKLFYTDAYLEPIQASKMELFVKLIHNFEK